MCVFGKGQELGAGSVRVTEMSRKEHDSEDSAGDISESMSDVWEAQKKNSAFRIMFTVNDEGLGRAWTSSLQSLTQLVGFYRKNHKDKTVLFGREREGRQTIDEASMIPFAG